jgi:hypothetical protein
MSGVFAPPLRPFNLVRCTNGLHDGPLIGRTEFLGETGQRGFDEPEGGSVPFDPSDGGVAPFRFRTGPVWFAGFKIGTLTPPKLCWLLQQT